MPQSYSPSEVEELPSFSADEVEEAPPPITAEQSAAAMDQVMRGPSALPRTKPAPAGFDLGPTPQKEPDLASIMVNEERARAASRIPVGPVSPGLGATREQVNRGQLAPMTLSRPALPGVPEPTPSRRTRTVVNPNSGVTYFSPVDDSPEAKQEADTLNQQEATAYLRGSGASGIPRISEGMDRYLGKSVYSDVPAEEREAGLAEATSGALEASTPLMSAGAGAAMTSFPAALRFTRDMVAIYGATKAAEMGAKKFHLTPAQTELLVNAVSLGAPLVAARSIDALEPRLDTLSGPGIKAAAGSVGRGTVGGFGAITPDEFAAGVKVGPVEGAVRIPRKRPPAEAQPALPAKPMTRAEAVEHLEATRGTPTVENPTGWNAEAEPEVEAIRRGAPPVQEVLPPENKVPQGQRASDLIKKAEQEKLSKAIEGRGAAKAEMEKPQEFKPSEVEEASGQPVAVPEGAKPKTITPGENAGTTQPTPNTQEATDWHQEALAKAKEKLGPGAPISQVLQEAAKIQKAGKPVELSPEDVEEAPKFKHRSTQANIAPESEAGKAIETARQRIPDSDLMAKGKDVGGSHVTVRYGLKPDSDIEGVKRFLAAQEPFEASLGKTDVFPPSESSDGAAVVHAPIESPDLHRINDEIQKHGEFAESNFKDFLPHSTIAYVSPEKANRYKGMTVTQGKKFTVNSIAITDRDGRQEEIKLQGKRGSVLPLGHESGTHTGRSGSETAAGGGSRRGVPDNESNTITTASAHIGGPQADNRAPSSLSREGGADTQGQGRSPQVPPGAVHELGTSRTNDKGSAREGTRPTSDALREGTPVQPQGQANGLERLSNLPSSEGKGLSGSDEATSTSDRVGSTHPVQGVRNEPETVLRSGNVRPVLPEEPRSFNKDEVEEAPTDVLDTIRKATEPVKTASKETLDQVAEIFARNEAPRHESTGGATPGFFFKGDFHPIDKASDDVIEKRAAQVEAHIANPNRVASIPELSKELKMLRKEQAYRKKHPFTFRGPSIDSGRKISTDEQQDQPEGTAGSPEDLSSVPGPESESGNAPASVSPEGNGETEEERDLERSPRPEDRERVERPERQPQSGEKPDRSGGSGAPAHPTPERAARGAGEGRPAGADGRAVESPTPEEPEQAKQTTAELRNQRNYRISDEYAATIGTGGEISKIKSNLDALETFKKIQAEGRELATPEEQEKIAKYVDFGGLVGMLQRYWEPQYKGHYERFTGLLTPDEIQEIRETLPNTHYTSMQVVDWMWEAMKRMGFRGGRILEPGMGIGNFFGRLPEKIAGRSELYGVERNPLTGGMTKLLYPDANIQVKPFQHFQIPNNSIDAVIGNVPFQDVTITDDPVYKDLKLNLHNYFIVKSLDKVRPGGIAALITSRYTMDGSKGAAIRAREEMAKRADLIAAIRLPDNAFKRTANTEVVADLLVFQKRDPSVTLDAMPDWTKTVPEKVGDREFILNKHFVDNPNSVIGTHSAAGSMYGPNQYTVKGPADFSKALEEASELFPKGVFGKQKAVQTPAPHTMEPSDLEFAPEDVKPGAYFRDEKGNIRIKQAGVGVKLPENLRGVDKLTHIGHAIDLRDQLNQTIATQLETADDEPLKEAQKKLGKLYDTYTKKYGSLHGPKLKQVFGDDPEYPKLLALENIDTENKQVTKAAIFTKRVLAPYEPLRELPDDPKSAMLKVIAERGYLDTKLMADLLKKDEAGVISNLENEGLIFQDPQSGTFHTSDDYLSGNVREKLRLAERAAETDKRFSRNVEALQKAQPKPLTIHEIQPNLGQTWIPMEIYKGFVRHLASSNRLDVEINRDASGKWLVQVDGNRNKLENAWSGGGISGHKLVQAALNQQQPSVWDKDSDGNRHLNAEKTTAAREKLAAIKEEFRTVLRRATPQVTNKLEQIYNDTFNAFKLREFSGEHLDFPGMSEEWRGKIRGYQKSAVWRILQEGRAGIFHAPGLGKTLTMVSAGMEARRLKLSRKNMYAVPNHMVPQWREDFKRFYPNANVLAVNDDDFTATNRSKLMSRIATGDWDAVIVPHSQFDLLPMSPEWESKTIEKRLDDYRSVLEELDKNDDKRTIKQIEKAVDKLEARLNELNSKKKDNTIAFDQLGVDLMFVDEAHAYKAMAVPSKMGNIGGLSNRASERAFALEMKADFMRDTHKGRGTVFATGTPITNTVGELYVMTKYLAPEMLEAAGIRSFDDWAANFATTITQWEYGADGVTFKPKTSLSEFVNVPELSTMFRRFAEYLSKADAKKLSNLKEPQVKRTDRMVKITPTQEPLLELIADRGEHLTKHPPRTKEERQQDNWLKLSGDARKISLDPRLYNPALRDDSGSKANQAVKDIKGVLERTSKEKGTVVVFSDFFQHKGPDDKPDFNLFEDMKRKLVKQGVPAEQIAIIHEAANKDEKEALFARVRSGKVRGLMGSTEKMGIGTNIQDRLKAELHLDQPWRPDQVEQREGRIERSGNMWDEVEIYRYIAEPEEGTVMRWDNEKQAEVEKPRPRAYDLQMYQQLARKANFQEQFLTGQYTGRTMEDTGGDVKLNSQMFQLAKAMATGNPDALKKIKIEHDLRTYSMLERNFQVEQSQNVRRQENLQMRIPILEKKIQMLKRDAELWEKAESNDAVNLQIGNTTRAGKELKEWLETEPSLADLVYKPVTVAGIQTEIDSSERYKKRDPNTGEWFDEIDYRYRLAGELHSIPLKTVKSFLNSFAQRARALGIHRENTIQDLRDSKEKLASIGEEVKRSSPYLDKIEKMEKDIAEINKRLGMTGPAEVDEGADQGEEDEKPAKPESLITGESGTFTPSALSPKRVKRVYSDFINKIIDQKLDLGDKYRRVADHDPTIAKMLHEKDNAPRYFKDKADSNVTQVTQGLSEDQTRLAAMMADSDAREYLEENHPHEFDQAQSDPAVMDAVGRFKKYQDELAAIRIKLGWHVRRDLSAIENEDGQWDVLDRNGDTVETFKSGKKAQEYVEDNGKLLDHLKRTYPEHKREPLMGTTNEGPSLGAPYGGIRPPRPDRKQRLATAEYFYQHGAKDFSGYVKSFTQAYHAALNQKIYDSLTDEATPYSEGTAKPPQIEYRGKTYYSPDVAKSMKLAKAEHRPKEILEYAAYDPAGDDKVLIKSFEDGWSTRTTGRPGIKATDRYLAPKAIVDALNNYDMTRGVQEGDSIRRFFQEQIVGLFGPTVHVFNIMRRLATTVGSGAWDPRVWPYYQKLFFSGELRERMAQGLADDAIDALSKHGDYTNTRDIGSLHAYFLGNLNPANWVRQTIGKFSKGVLFDPKFLGGFGGVDQKARVLAYDYLREEAGMGEDEAAKNVEDGFGNYNKANWTERMRRWARVLLFPGWDFSSLKWFLRHPIKTAILPAMATMAANLALNKAGKNKEQDRYDYGYIHYGDRKLRSSIFTEAMAMHIMEPLLAAAKSALEGGNSRDMLREADEGAKRGAGGVAGSLRPELTYLTDIISNRKYPGGTTEIYKPEDANIPGKYGPWTRKTDKEISFTILKAFPAISRFMDSQGASVDLGTGLGSVIGITNYKSGAEERLRANGAKSMAASQTYSILAESDPAAAEKFVSDPQKAIYLAFNKDLSELEGDLKKIDKQMEEVKLAPGISRGDRESAIKSLSDSRKQILNSADAIADAMQAARLQMK